MLQNGFAAKVCDPDAIDSLHGLASTPSADLDATRIPTEVEV